MFYGLSGRDVFESGQISIKKRAAGGGQDNRTDAVPVQTACVIVRQDLENGVVLTVDGQDSGTVGSGGFHKQRAGYDQRFFVGQINGFTLLRGRQCRR